MQPTTAGSLLVAYVREGTSDTVSWTVTDDAGQTWSQSACGYVSTNNTNRAAMSYVANSASMTTVTATFSANAAPASIVILEVAGAATSGVEDNCTNNSVDVAVTTIDTGALTTSNPDDILIDAVGVTVDQTGFSSATGFTLLPNASNVRMAMQFATVSSYRAAR